MTMVEYDVSSDLYDRGLLDAGISAFVQNSVEVIPPSISHQTYGSIPQLLRDFESRDEPVKICAPMVRYSKLAFRRLVRKYDADLCFTPMIVADAFVKSIKGTL